eukprot:scaffold985_cov145-Skeletonema_menzelii.AAC.6
MFPSCLKDHANTFVIECCAKWLCVLKFETRRLVLYRKMRDSLHLMSSLKLQLAIVRASLGAGFSRDPDAKLFLEKKKKYVSRSSNIHRSHVAQALNIILVLDLVEESQEVGGADLIQEAEIDQALALDDIDQAHMAQAREVAHDREVAQAHNDEEESSDMDISSDEDDECEDSAPPTCAAPDGTDR